MPDKITRRSALAATYQIGSFGTGAGLTIVERHPLTLLDIGGTPSERELGYAVPTVPNTVTYVATRRICWLSPKRWLLIESDPDCNVPTDICIDVSSGRTAIRLQGPRARNVLAKGCPLDLHPRQFLINHCAQSKIGSHNVLIDHFENDGFDIYISRSFAQSFWQWLLKASSEYGYRVLPII